MLPKISCLIVTCGRIALIKRSIQCFCDQTYPNRELIIITNEEAEIISQLTHCIASFGDRADIKFEALSDRKYTLGELRNKSIEKASGEIVCIWDDDDLYHPERLMQQYKNMEESKAEVSLLSTYLHFFETDLVLGWSVWGSRLPDAINGLPGSLMMYRHLAVSYPNSGDYANAGEDSYILYRLYQSGVKVALLPDKAYLYIYCFHGKNTWAEEHHKGLFYNLHKKQETLSVSQKEALANALPYFQLPEGIKIV